MPREHTGGSRRTFISLGTVVTAIVRHRRHEQERLAQNPSFWIFLLSHPLFCLSAILTVFCWLSEAGYLPR
jgi:hypothetical protein